MKMSGVRRSKGPTKFAVTVKPKQYKTPKPLIARNMQTRRRRSAFWWGFWRQMGYRAANRVIDGPKGTKPVPPTSTTSDARAFTMIMVFLVVIFIIVAYNR